MSSRALSTPARGGGGIGTAVNTQRKLLFANRNTKRIFIILAIDALLTFIFAVMEDTREYDSQQLREKKAPGELDDGAEEGEGEDMSDEAKVAQMALAQQNGVGEEDAFMQVHGEEIERKLREARETREELARAERQRDELARHVSHLEREAVVNGEESDKLNDDLAGVQAERDLLERKVNELRRDLHAKNKEIEGLEAELKLSKSQQVRAMAKLSVQRAKAEKQLVALKEGLQKLNEDKAALFREVSSLEAQLAQAHADREEARNWASTYRDMLLKVT